MKKLCIAALAACSLGFTAIPAAAQEEEQARTTYRVMAIDVKSGSAGRWEEIMMETVIPAYEAAGLPTPQLHWVMVNGDWDYMVVVEMPDGMAAFDSHNPPGRTALFASMVESLGSEEAVQELFSELNGLEEDSVTLYTHTHP